jgi:chorismate-pyruvate lyase
MIVADRLTELHFTAQLESSAAGLHAVEVARLDPLLRGLLFTDGTVSRALEAQTLMPVLLETVEQSRAVMPAREAGYMDVAEGEECIRRRVVMTIDGPAPSVWAQSYVVPRRLPADFVGVLENSSHGIGGSLQQLRLESWRELLWFGLGSPPAWAGEESAAVAGTLTRVYRIITDGLPALLISEAFAVEPHLGEYRLAIAPGTPAAGGANAGSGLSGRTRIVLGDRGDGGRASATD